MKYWKAALGLAITVGLLWWAFSGIDLADVWEKMRTGNFVLLGAAVVVTTAGFAVRAMRWKVLLAEIAPDSAFHPRFKAVSIGFMTNNVLPSGRVGEFTRAIALSRLEKVPFSGAFGTLVVERLLDAAVLISMLLVVVSLPSFPMADVLEGGVLGAGVDGAKVVVTGAVAGVIVTLLWPGMIIGMVERFSLLLPQRWRPGLVGAARAFIDSLRVLSRPRLVLLALAWTVGFWTWNAFSFWLAMKAFGIDLSMLAAIFTQTVVGFGVAVPAAPGFAGTFHAAAMWAVETPYGVDGASAGAFAVAYHLATWFPITAIGLYYAWKMDWSLRDMQREGLGPLEAESRVLHPEPGQ